MSLRLKLALSGTLLLALSLGLVTWYTLGILRDHFDSQQQARVLQLRPLLNAALSVPLLQRDYASVQAILEETLEDPALQQLQAYDSAGRLVAAARRPSAATPGAAAGALADFRADLALAGQAIGAVTFTLSRADLDQAQARIARYVIGVGSLALVFFSALLWVLSGTVTRRLQHLVDASRSIREGQYAPALPAPSTDEVGLLVQAFSAMSGEIQRKVDELRALNDGLEREVQQRTHDLTQRTLELDRSVHALQTKTDLLNRAPFAVVVLDADTPDFRIVDVTDALREVFGHAADRVIGQPVACLEPADALGVLGRQLRAAAGSARSLEWEAGVRCGPGHTRWTRCLAFALRDNPHEGARLALCLVDIQEIWQAREDQRRLAGDLQESNKLQSVSLAIAGIAHDLNTPVGIALTGSTKVRDTLLPLIEAPAAGGAAPDDVSVSLERLRRLHRTSELVASNLAKAGELVKSLKATTANVSRVEWRKVGLQPLFDSLLVTLSPITHRARCAVHVTCPSDLSIYTEPGSLGQVITNLVVNATLHAFEGRDSRELRIEASVVAGQVVIRVADNGNGMNAEAAARAFTPFFTTQRASGGSGLGLFSARRVVEDVLGGSIVMRNQPGQGVTFEITLPLHDQPPQAAEGSPAAPGRRAVSG
ncbi:MAG: hypothetical protein RL014_766 [Pseudomonadota bacterium]|jgi:signal transduction histidine kinase